MPGPAAALLGGGRRLHLQHGPIDLVIAAWGDPGEVAEAYRQAATAFDGLLEGLVAELPLLRAPIAPPRPQPDGPVAARMVDAVWPHRAAFVTPMAAVAGAVADHMLARLGAGRTLERAYVNNGGDIAVHLGPDARLAVGMVADVAEPRIDGSITLEATDPVRGIATSGRGGRSFSLGIADAVTVLAADAASADAAATLIADAVDLDHPAIRRRPARELDPDSDLGTLPVTVAVGPLPAELIDLALDRGAEAAHAMRRRGLIAAACLRLRGGLRLVGPMPLTAPETRHARMDAPAAARGRPAARRLRRDRG